MVALVGRRGQVLGVQGVGWYSILLFTSSYLGYVFAFSIFHFQQQANDNLLTRQCLHIPRTECILQNFLGWTGLVLES